MSTQFSSYDILWRYIQHSPERFTIFTEELNGLCDDINETVLLSYLIHISHYVLLGNQCLKFDEMDEEVDSPMEAWMALRKVQSTILDNEDKYLMAVTRERVNFLIPQASVTLKMPIKLIKDTLVVLGYEKRLLKIANTSWIKSKTKSGKRKRTLRDQVQIRLFRHEIPVGPTGITLQPDDPYGRTIEDDRDVNGLPVRIEARRTRQILTSLIESRN